MCYFKILKEWTMENNLILRYLITLQRSISLHLYIERIFAAFLFNLTNYILMVYKLLLLNYFFNVRVSVVSPVHFLWKILMFLLFWLLWISRSGLCFAQRTNWSISMNLLMTWKTRFHWWRLLPKIQIEDWLVLYVFQKQIDFLGQTFNN